MRRNGYSYLGLLFGLALAGTALAAAGTLWRIESQRDKEAELLFAGAQFRAAIGAYWQQTPAGQQPAFPRRLDDLLDDKRWPGKRRHLRRVFVDPMTGSTEWGQITGPGGGIFGVHSLSARAPLKRAGFGADHDGFAEADDYRGWRFVFSPSAVDAQPR